MTIGVLTLAQLKTLFHDITVSILGLDGAMVRNQFPEDGQPIGRAEDNLVYISITPVDSDYANFRDIQFVQDDAENTEERVFYNRVMQVSWILYGPASFDNADLLRHGLLLESNRGTLAAQGVYPLSVIPQATRLPDNFNGQWWERSDLQATVNIATLRTSAVPYLQAATVEIIDDHGLERTIDITVHRSPT